MSVREVGVVDPETKVDVKSVVSGRVVSLKVRDGAVVKAGDVLAEVEPDVTQAQSLSDVRAGVTQAEVALKDADRQLASQERLFKEGPHRERDAQGLRHEARPRRRERQGGPPALPDRRGPRHPDLAATP